MATPVIQNTIRTNLGPLTTATWTYTCTEVIQGCGNCDKGWAAQTCIRGVVTDNTDCWPPRATNVPATSGALLGWGVYSPGIVCPGGYTSVAAATYDGTSDFSFQYPLTAGETAIGCCPKGGFIPILDVNKKQTCVQFKPTTSFLVGSCGNDGPAYTPFTIGGTLNSTTYNSFSVSAPFFQAVHQASDLPATSTPTSTNTQSSSSTSNSPTAQSSDNSSQASRSLSAGATAGIAVGVILGVIIIATAAFCAWRVRRRKQQHVAELPNTNFQPSDYKQPYGAAGGGVPAENPVNAGVPLQHWQYDGHVSPGPPGVVSVNPNHPAELAHPAAEIGPSYGAR
ncbi:hypothetical protein F4859DRAFT_275137 [Xylaria cf. heliscus]|nr:hypothetical protein F4859DRAFT_275137 [Xylaria cf. heliscus]